jgi:hypothetical protein
MVTKEKFLCGTCPYCGTALAGFSSGLESERNRRFSIKLLNKEKGCQSMDEDKNRRRFKRVNVKLSATVRVDGGEETKAEVRNISQGGALIHCEVPIAAVGQILFLSIKLKNSNLELKAKVFGRGAVEVNLDDEEPDKSVIRWVGDNANFGVQFVDLKPDKQVYLAQLVDFLATKFGWDE